MRDRLHVREPQLQQSLPLRLPEGLAPLHHHDKAVRANEPPQSFGLLCHHVVLDHLVVCSHEASVLCLVLAGPSMSCSGTAPTAAIPLPSRSPAAKLGQRLQGQAGDSHRDTILRLLSYSEISFRKLQTVSYVDAFVRFGRGVELRWVEIAAPF